MKESVYILFFYYILRRERARDTFLIHSYNLIFHVGKLPVPFKNNYMRFTETFPFSNKGDPPPFESFSATICGVKSSGDDSQITVPSH